MLMVHILRKEYRLINELYLYVPLPSNFILFYFFEIKQQIFLFKTKKKKNYTLEQAC